MEDLIVKGGNYNPEIKLLASEHRIEIRGMSLPENPNRLFEPVVEWIDRYIETQSVPPKVYFDLDYCNTGSSKWINIIVNRMATSKLKPEIFWHYKEEDMKDIGHYLEDLNAIEFKMIEIN